MIEFCTTLQRDQVINILRSDTKDWYYFYENDEQKIIRGLALHRKGGRWTKLKKNNFWIAQCTDIKAAKAEIDKEFNITEYGRRPSSIKDNKTNLTVQEFLDWSVDDLARSLTPKEFNTTKIAINNYKEMKEIECQRIEEEVRLMTTKELDSFIKYNDTPFEFDLFKDV